MLVKVGRSRLWGQKEIPDEWCGMGFRNAEKLSRRVPRRLREFFRLRRGFLDRKTHRFCAIHRVVGVTTALTNQGVQEALQSVYRLGFP